jgi:ribonuclease Z
MTKFVVLGSAYSIPAEGHENTHLLIEEGGRLILVDASASPTVHIQKAGFSIGKLSDIILTHFHPDHVYGVPLILMDLWLLGRKEELHIHALETVCSKAMKLMDLFGWKEWPDFFPVHFHSLKGEGIEDVLQLEGLQVTATAVRHLVPTIGLRFDFTTLNRSVAYSCDTEPCEEFIRLADKADVMLHESVGKAKGHTSPEDAGRIASAARAGRLYLIHYPPLATGEKMVAEAGKYYKGPVELARDYLSIPLE